MELIDWLVEHLAVAALATFAYWCVRERLWTALEPRLLRWRIYHPIKTTAAAHKRTEWHLDRVCTLLAAGGTQWEVNRSRGDIALLNCMALIAPRRALKRMAKEMWNEQGYTVDQAFWALYLCSLADWRIQRSFARFGLMFNGSPEHLKAQIRAWAMFPESFRLATGYQWDFDYHDYTRAEPSITWGRPGLAEVLADLYYERSIPIIGEAASLFAFYLIHFRH